MFAEADKYLISAHFEFVKTFIHILFNMRLS